MLPDNLYSPDVHFQKLETYFGSNEEKSYTTLSGRNLQQANLDITPLKWYKSIKITTKDTLLNNFTNIHSYWVKSMLNPIILCITHFQNVSRTMILINKRVC